MAKAADREVGQALSNSTQPPTLQQRLKATLARAGIPYRDIHCYGSQIVVTSDCRETAQKWATLLANIATVRGIHEWHDYTAVNSNTVLRPSTVRVWRAFAVVRGSRS